MFHAGVKVGEKDMEKLSAGEAQHKENFQREDADIEKRNAKQVAIYNEDPVIPDMIDKWSLYTQGEGLRHLILRRDTLQSKAKRSSSQKGRPKKNGPRKEVVDLRGPLLTCAEAMASNNYEIATQLLKKIRQLFSPFGDGNQRLTHCFVDALEARLAGTGNYIYERLMNKEKSFIHLLKAHNLYLAACPFDRVFDLLTNETIMNLVKNSKKIHIIDFGIYYSFQWPTLIHQFSLRSGGPPRLKITGIEYPLHGFRPADKANEVGHYLASYAKRFLVPFEYNVIAKDWQDIQVEDLEIDKEEVTVVNSCYKFENTSDEPTMDKGSPRDIVLKLVRNIEPNIFLHRITNGGYGSPYFITRFREAFFHFSALFDMYETIVSREDSDRMLTETVIFGKIIVNVIACEGSQRVERPETYHQWGNRISRAGFIQLPFDQIMVNKSIDHVKSCYYKDFYICEDCEWLLQGWKGRIISAMSVWKPS